VLKIAVKVKGDDHLKKNRLWMGNVIIARSRLICDLKKGAKIV